MKVTEHDAASFHDGKKQREIKTDNVHFSLPSGGYIEVTPMDCGIGITVRMYEGNTSRAMQVYPKATNELQIVAPVEFERVH